MGAGVHREEGYRLRGAGESDVAWPHGSDRTFINVFPLLRTLKKVLEGWMPAL